MKICGPKCSLCGLVISVWGIIQLVCMGIFYYAHSVALLEDIHLQESYTDTQVFFRDADNGYAMNAYNCWIAACLYIFTLVFSAHQFYVNSRMQV
ncbi:ribonuclease kappa-B-like [Cimex lectularius]|uniref:Uncharacterized protein n=1 Tax=Cimex lectularius TaxID=79782 RepID=A0A8I6THF9_CIMLE|nr:ribonuclease kappa-B-like [Cimex lectularius]